MLELRLVPISFDHRDSAYRAYWKYSCACGGQKIIRKDHVDSGRVVSCGCVSSEIKKKPKKHGHTGGAYPKYSPTYMTWISMRKRCENPKSNGYPTYGAMGITVSRRWQKFENFLADMGERPVGKTLHRKNGKKGYSKDNCVWAMVEEQNRNRKSVIHLIADGQYMSVKAAAVKFHTMPWKIYDWLYNDRPLERLFKCDSVVAERQE